VALGRSAWIALGAFGALGGCSLLAPLGGLTEGDGTPVEAGAEAAAPSDSGPLDGQGIAITPPDGGISCATLSPAPRLCVDFSNELVVSTGPPTGTSFEAIQTRNAPPATIDRSTFGSPSASARFTFGASSDRSYLQRIFPGPPPSSIQFSMAMRFDPSSDDVHLDLMEIRFGGKGGFFLKRQAGGKMTIESYTIGQPFKSIPVPGVMKTSTFATYAWVADLGGAPTLSMSIDGEEVLTRAALLPFSGSTATELVAGCTDYYTNAASTLWVDDVIVRF
jgi:hypothetical protein